MATNDQKPGPMDDHELKSVVGQQIMHSRSYLSAEVGADRQQNLRMYLNRPLGNEVEGRSQVISTDVQDTIEAIMPDLVEMFTASGAIWKYEPTGPEDEAFTEQVADYVHDVVWSVDNHGFKISHDAIKNVLLEKNGVFKVWWDDSRPEREEAMREVSIVDLLVLDSDPNVEIVEAEENMYGDVPTGLFDIKIRRKRETGRCVIEVVPSEEFLVSTRVRELDETASFCAHRRYMSRSELIEMGYDKDFVWNLPTIEGNNNANLDRSRVRHARFSDDRSAMTDYGVQAPSEREVEVYECYMLLDYDGDGVSSRYLVRTAGSDGDVLLPDPDTGEKAVEIDDHPFVSMEAIRQPGRFFGRAVADLVRDIQLIKSTIQRQMLDNVYNINNQRAAISTKVELDDWLNNDVGAAVPVDDTTAVGHVVPIVPQSIVQFAQPMLAYWDEVLQDRSGISGGAEPMDPKAFHETFAGANLMLGQMMKRLLFYARVMAETGFKDLGKKILRCIVLNQDAPRTVRLRNKWVPVDPRRWNAELDVKVVAGLGHGTKETRLAGAMQIAQTQDKIVRDVQRGSLAGPFVTPNEVDNTLDVICDSLSMDRSMFFGELTPQANQILSQPPQPEPDEVEKLAQMQMQIERGKAELKMMQERLDARIDVLKIQEDARQHNDEMAAKMVEIESKYGVEQQKLQLSYMQAEAKAQEGSPMPVNVTYQTGEEVNSMLMSQGEAINEKMQGLSEMTAALIQAADAMTRPRRLIRDESGRPVGSEVVTDEEAPA